MNLLRTIPIPLVINTSQHDFSSEFFLPLLSHAVRYDRGVGFFSSGWLRINAQGLTNFAMNGGYARWITSPILDAHDWQAMLQGDQARRDTLLHDALEKNIDDLKTSLERDTLSALAWLIADEILEFRIAIPANNLVGEFHAKFGIFSDEQGNKVSFEGSYNDSIQGTRNYESMKIFCSWIEGYEEIVTHDEQRFETLWCNEDPNVRVYVLPEIVRQKLLKLRVKDRPYTLPAKIGESRSPLYELVPRRPIDLTLRDYQENAIQAWFDHQGRGIFEMATGTGKTITSLSAMTRLYGRDRQLAVIISCPFQHLVDQWHQEANRFGIDPLLAYRKKDDWFSTFRKYINEYNHNDRSFFAVITTHTTFNDEDFQSLLKNIKNPVLLIADEMHNLGAEQRRKGLLENIQYRLGLSATPDRWFDDHGSTILREYFGETVFRYSLEEAINTVLTPYFYYPILVELNQEETSEYDRLSKKISRLMHSDDRDIIERRELLLIKRSQLLNNAHNKLAKLSEQLKKMENIDHALFYCSPEQIDAVCKIVGWDHDLRIHRFTAEEPNPERQKLLKDFSTGQLDGLVAMKCLDEGVDVPNTRMAFILASSSNPREFIQRRGRILRRAEGKHEAYIYDFMTIPAQNWHGNSSFEVERGIVRRELQRFKEFANCALNKHQAINVIKHIAQRYEIYEV